MGRACDVCVCVCVGGGGENCTQVLVGKLKGADYSEDLGVDRMIILKWILRK
jgi:hypothetical protein